MKRLALLATGLMLVLVLVACGGSPSVTTTAPETTPPMTTPPATTPPVTTPPVTTTPVNTPTVSGDSVAVFGADNPFRIVYGANNSVGASAAGAVYEKITSLGMSVSTPCTDSSKSETACELVVGESSRAISASAKAAIALRIEQMPDSLHWVWLYSDGQLALYASSADAYSAAIAELSTKYLLDGKIVFKTTAREIGLVKVPVPVIQGGKVVLFGGSDDFTVVYGANDPGGKAAADGIASAIGTLGLTAKTASDADKLSLKCELLVGETDRSLSKIAAAALAEKLAERPHDEHWLWLYKNGQLALVASNGAAYERAIAELKEKYLDGSKVKMDAQINAFGLFEHTHDAVMEYTVPSNFYDGYTDPFGMTSADYKTMTLTKVSAKTYRISYTDSLGGLFEADLVQKNWGLWAMGAMSYTEAGGKKHQMTTSSTDYEFVFKVGAKTPLSFRSGNHGDYPGDGNWQYYADESSESNDRLLDMTFYDGKSGEKITLDTVGASVTVNGLRIVMHHNVYEMNYTAANVLLCAERSYLYNGTDIHVDSKFYVPQTINLGRGYSCMLPVSKAYGNYASFERADGTKYLMKTVAESDKGNVNQDEVSLGINAVRIDVWGERNPACHLKIAINNPEDMYKNSVTDREKNGFAGLRDMQAGSTNKIYCSLFSEVGSLRRGDELHFSSTYSFSYEPNFQNPVGEPDRWVGLIQK